MSDTTVQPLLNSTSLVLSLKYQQNATETVDDDEFYFPERDPLSWVIPMTVLYSVIFITGLVGNVCTCVVIVRNRLMHTSTNCYLFSLALSDLLLLIVGMPQELYQLWNRYPYIFGEAFCILRGLTSETSTNASILTITSFTIERYLAVCQPLRTQGNASVSRAIRIAIAAWIVGIVCAAPLAFQFGVVLRNFEGRDLNGTAECTLKRPLHHAFEISTVIFFVLPMIVISVLYTAIGIRLRKPDRTLHRSGVTRGPSGSKMLNRQSTRSLRGGGTSRRTVIRMLLSVVVAFFVCWAPFHAQRLMALHSSEKPSDTAIYTYTVLTYISGVTYYVSATINPILYSIMSVKFREAFKKTLASSCFTFAISPHASTMRNHRI